MLENLLSRSRYLVIIAVLGALIASITVLVYAGIVVVGIMIVLFAHFTFTTEDAEHVAVASVEMIDMFLLSTILYIMSLGLYRLFINDKLPLPHWLEVSSLKDLKEKLLGVIIVLVAVTFLGDLVSWAPGDMSILGLGLAAGLVLVALGYVLSTGAISHKGAQTEATNDRTQAE
jgi:uncharacterized membrane protein YqhA